MAKETITKLIDDLDGTAAHETVKFGLDGQLYEIDLSAKNAQKLRQEVIPFAERAVRVSTKSPLRAAQAGARANADAKARNTAIREWARECGYTIGDKGVIKAEIVEAYDAAGGQLPLLEPVKEAPARKSRRSAPRAAFQAA